MLDVQTSTPALLTQFIAKNRINIDVLPAQIASLDLPYKFYPLVYKEIPDFNLLRALNHGLLPSHYLSEQPMRMLRAYVADYLNEEIQAEGLVRNLAGFSSFLEMVGLCNG